MATRCSICNSEHCAAIDDLADSGTATLKEIAQQFGCSYASLVRHAARHGKNAPAPATPENSESLEAQAEKWLRRADDIYATADANQDARGQVAALGAAFRGLELQHKAELKAAEAAPAATGITLEEIDRIVHGENMKTQHGRTFEKALELAVKLADHPATWAAVETILSESTRVN